MLLFGSGNWMQRSGSHNLPIMPLPFSMGFDFEELKTKITQLFERCWPVLSQTTSQRTNVQATHTHTHMYINSGEAQEVEEMAKRMQRDVSYPFVCSTIVFKKNNLFLVMFKPTNAVRDAVLGRNEPRTKRFKPFV